MPGTENTPPKLTKAQKEWATEIGILRAFAEKDGLTVELRNPEAPEYQLARLTCDGVRLIAYPHRTTAGNYHIRIRNENSKDRAKAQTIMEHMYWGNNWVEGKGYCGFEVKEFPTKPYHEVYSNAGRI
jgi:hypothetical protein